MIRVFNIPALTWTLTAILLAGGTYHLWQAARSPHLTDRVNNTLHTLMNTLMAAMLWNLAPSTTLAQIGLLAAAALWFIIQAVARPEYKLLCAGTQGRLKCAYHALTMTAAALMITLMTHPTTTTPTTPANQTPTPMPMPMAHAHHTMTTTPTTTTAAPLGHTPALLLTLLFTTAALTFLILLLRTPTTHPKTRQHHTRTEHALEALSATTMALMFATTT
ncbi:DUF5134 domain-containing protein [Arthrobacter sp. NPDC056691]|uniref:DUF5134 domain-containing protein n=1 Tax=Arthrobacter sp. NPDC056691 TaxID=3345913 RepID=UPI00366FFC00